MKKMLVVLALLGASISSFAKTQKNDLKWVNELKLYNYELQSASRERLTWNLAVESVKMAATCGSDVMLIGASFLADTFPVVGAVSEAIANILDGKYETADYDSLVSWAAAKQGVRGTAGGGMTAVVESLEYVMLYLTGDTSQAYEATSKVYESSLATLNKLLSNNAPCMMSLNKMSLVLNQLEKTSPFKNASYKKATSVDTSEMP